MTRHLPEAERRTQILRAARRVFVEQGFGAARMQDVARAAGLSKGAVYFYFDSKRALLRALVAEEHAATLGILEDSDAALPPAARLLALGQRYLDYFADLSGAPRFFLLMSEQSIRDEELRALVVAMHQRYLTRIEAVIAAGVACGDFRDVNPAAVALLLKAVMDGLAGQAAMGEAPDAALLREDGIGVILNGLLP